MIEKVVKFNRVAKEVFENLETNSTTIINHVILKPNQKFPSHETVATVYIIVNSGAISLKLGAQPGHIYEEGNLIILPVGIQSALSNASQGITELFVVKSKK